MVPQDAHRNAFHSTVIGISAICFFSSLTSWPIIRKSTGIADQIVGQGGQCTTPPRSFVLVRLSQHFELLVNPPTRTAAQFCFCRPHVDAYIKINNLAGLKGRASFCTSRFRDHPRIFHLPQDYFRRLWDRIHPE